MTPMPVTATRRVILGEQLLSQHQLLNSLHHLAYGFNGRRLLIGNRDIELILDGEQDIHAVERIEFQVRESLVDGDGFRRQVLGFRNHLDHAGSNSAGIESD